MGLVDRFKKDNQISHKLKSPFKAYNGDKTYIFVSYKHNDADIVYPVIKQFHDMGFNIWYDEGLPYGENFDIIIPKKIKGAKLFINFLTNECMSCANNSEDYMIKESDIAQYCKIPILAIYLESDVILDGYYLTNFLKKQSLYRQEYGDNEELFIDTCVDVFIDNGVIPNEVDSRIEDESFSQESCDEIATSLIHESSFPPYNGDEPYIYVSYAYKDAYRVFPEIKMFHDDGYNICYDQGINVGNEWANEIANSVDRCSLFVIFITQNSVTSRIVNNELYHAIDQNKHILPIFLEKTELPPGIGFELSATQGVLKYEMTDEEYVEKIRSRLKRYELNVF